MVLGAGNGGWTSIRRASCGGDDRFSFSDFVVPAHGNSPPGIPTWTAIALIGMGQFPHPETPKVGPSPFPLRESEGRALPHPPPGIPTGFCHEARGCAAEALPWVNAQHINNPEGVVPGHHAGRLSSRGRIRQNGKRDHGFSRSQPALCGVIHTFVPSAQPRCGCCK